MIARTYRRVPADLLQRQILERMINDLVQVQLAKETGIKVDDLALDRTIERISQENSLTLVDFRKALERDGIRYPRFREDIRGEIMLARLREPVASSRWIALSRWSTTKSSPTANWPNK